MRGLWGGHRMIFKMLLSAVSFGIRLLFATISMLMIAQWVIEIRHLTGMVE
jgi:hypothetical protein